MAAKERKRWTVEVTESDIARAHKNDSYECVVAQAVARTVTDATRIEVDVASIRFTREGKRFIYPTPYSVQGYVVAFDAGEAIEPFDFQLRNPSITSRRVRTEAGNAKDRERKRKREGKPSDPADAALIVEAQAKGEVSEPVVGGEKGRKKPPPRMHKQRQRSYGHRALRVNQ